MRKPVFGLRYNINLGVSHCFVTSDLRQRCCTIFVAKAKVVSNSIIEPPRRKTNNVVFEQVRHILGLTATKESQKLEILGLRRKGILLSEYRKQRR